MTDDRCYIYLKFVVDWYCRYLAFISETKSHHFNQKNYDELCHKYLAYLVYRKIFYLENFVLKFKKKPNSYTNYSHNL